MIGVGGLYFLPQARGRVVGIQETLIGLAQILEPLIIVCLGASKPSAFWTAAAIITVGILPLFMAFTLPAMDTTATSKNLTIGNSSQFSFKRIMLLLSYGGFIAGIGGWIEGGLIALLPVYNTDWSTYYRYGMAANHTGRGLNDIPVSCRLAC